MEIQKKSSSPKSFLAILLMITALSLFSLTACTPSGKTTSSSQSTVDYSKLTLTNIQVSEMIDETAKTAIDPQTTFNKSVGQLWLTTKVGGGISNADVKCYVYVFYEDGGNEFSVYSSSELASDGDQVAYPVTLSSFDSDKIGSYIARFYAGPDDTFITSITFEVTE